MAVWGRERGKTEAAHGIRALHPDSARCAEFGPDTASRCNVTALPILIFPSIRSVLDLIAPTLPDSGQWGCVDTVKFTMAEVRKL